MSDASPLFLIIYFLYSSRHTSAGGYSVRIEGDEMAHYYISVYRQPTDELKGGKEIH